jgi:hypothetical protein
MKPPSSVSPGFVKKRDWFSAFQEARRGRLAFALLAGFLFLGGAQLLHAATSLVPVGATWRYLDNGSDPGPTWRGSNFNDSAWAAGPAELGYGDGGEATVVNSGPSGSHFATTYFRHRFAVTNLAAISNLAVRLLRDDGGIVYLNGVEVFRLNMPEGPAVYNSWAAVSISGSEETTFFGLAISTNLLVQGTNVVAVEIHQSDPGSSDVSFNLELVANSTLGNLPPLPAFTSPYDGLITGSDQVFTISVTASDPETFVTKIDVLQDGALIRTFLANSGTFTWSNAAVGIHEYTLRATDSAGLIGSSAPMRVLVTPADFQAQSVFFSQFPSGNGLILQGDTTTTSNVLHLVRPTGSGGGAAWMSGQQSVLDGFFSEFRFRITSKVGGGADGFAFLIAGTQQPIFGSGGIRYNDITNSLAVEFDTWQNSGDADPDDHHIAVHSRGVLANSQSETASLGLYTPAVDFSDGVVHKVFILYFPGSFLVFLDNFNTPVLSLNVDLGTLLSLPNGTAWIGFSGGSGGSTENHDIGAWSYTGFGNVSPTVTLTSPSQAVRVAPGSNLTLSALVSDPNGNVVNVEFYDGFDFIGETAHAPFNFVWTNPPAGIHAIVATAADSGGLFGVSAPVVVEVISSNATVNLLPNFSGASNLILQGSAAVVANRLRVTPALPSQTGGAWLNSKQALALGFETVFQFQVGQPSGQGADGFAFVILGQESPVLGTAGDDLGYGSLTRSLAIEFDTYQNPATSDLDANHIGIHSRGTQANSSDESASLARVSPPIDMSDGTIHTVVIRYSDGLLRVFLDDLNNAPVLQLSLNLGTLLALDNGAAWVGFTAATGGDFENHDILMWSFRPNAAAPQIQLASPGVGPFVVPTNILLSANASDPDGDIAFVKFFVDGISIGEVDQFPFTKAWNNPAAGTHLLTATATDEFGVATDSATVALSVVERPLVARPIVQANGSVMIAFPTTSGQTYTVQYSANLVNWTNAVPSLNGTGAVVSWHDTGPPITDSPPQNQPQRFYRVIVSP